MPDNARGQRDPIDHDYVVPVGEPGRIPDHDQFADIRGGAGGGGNRPDKPPEGGAARNARTKPEPTRQVTVNGRTYTVSKQAAAGFGEFIKDYKETANVGGVLAALASFAGLFGLVSSPEAVAVTIGSGDLGEVEVHLQALDTWNQATRTMAIDRLRLEQFKSERDNRRSDAEAWQHLREVLQEPSRYKANGIRKNADGSLWMAPLPGRTESGTRSILLASAKDQELLLGHLATLYTASEFNARVIRLTDVWQDALVGAQEYALSPRDHALLNKLLLSQPAACKRELATFFDAHCHDMLCSRPFWSELTSCLNSDKRAWREAMTDGGAWVDSL